MSLSVLVEAPGWRGLRGLSPLAGRCVAAALGRRQGAITLLFTSDAEMRRLNRLWRGKDKPTNVLSFPAGEGPRLRGQTRPLGDIALGYGIIAKESRAQGKSLRNHTAHLLVHGVLHLIGYDHENDEDAARMEAQERRVLARLGIANPYLVEEA